MTFFGFNIFWKPRKIKYQSGVWVRNQVKIRVLKLVSFLTQIFVLFLCNCCFSALLFLLSLLNLIFTFQTKNVNQCSVLLQNWKIYIITVIFLGLKQTGKWKVESQFSLNCPISIFVAFSDSPNFGGIKLSPLSPAIAKIISVKNLQAWVSMVLCLKKNKE